MRLEEDEDDLLMQAAAKVQERLQSSLSNNHPQTG
jgi:hypothetical protein